MLVLSRKSGEKIQIGDEISVEVRRVAGNRVTIAIAAPRNIRILRGELERVVDEFRDAPEKASETTDVSGPYLIAETTAGPADNLQSC